MVITNKTCFQFRLVMKTALKLQLLFVDYAEMNAMIFVKSVEAYHANTRK